jgi:hypothetical protein
MEGAMRKAFYYIARMVQATGLLLILHAFYISAFQDGSMGMLYSFSGVGMGIFMAGWMLQRFS